MKVALVQPPPRSEFDKHWARFAGLGIAYVASSLRAAGHEIDMLDGKLAHLTVDDIVQRVREGKPDLVGITCMTVEYPRAVQIATRIKHDRPDLPIVVGGAHVNAVGRQALEEGAAFDYACVGEGEFLVRELAEALERSIDTSPILGLVSRKSGEIVDVSASAASGGLRRASVPGVGPVPPSLDDPPHHAPRLSVPVCLLLPQLGLQAPVSHASQRARRGRGDPRALQAEPDPDRRRDVRAAHGEDEEDPRGDHRPRIAPPDHVLGANAGRSGRRGVHAAPQDCKLRDTRARSRVRQSGCAS